MTTIQENALADVVHRKPVTIDDILRLVDELANVSTPTISSRIVRLGLVTELRKELRPSLGSTGNGRGSGGVRINFDVEGDRVFETVTDRIRALAIDLDPDAAPRTGSLEQILNAWARDLVAADVDARTRQDIVGLEITGLNQDALRLMLHRVTRIRDTIEQHFNPAAHGDIPGAQCPVCAQTVAQVPEDGDLTQMPALGFRKPSTGLIVECRNPECLATWRGPDELRMLERQVLIFRTFFGGQL